MREGKNVILVADDEKEIRDILGLLLEGEGYLVLKAQNGEEVLEQADSEVDLYLLDVDMPQMTGFAAAAKLRKTYLAPIIFLTAYSGESDKVLGFSVGADDYIAKPFRPLELVSRVKNVLRRRGRSRSVLRAGDLLVDTVKGTVTRDGQEIILSALEYRLFLVFLNRQGEVLTRNRLLEEIWDIAGDYVNDNTLTVYIKRLRDKIEKDPAHPEIIETVRGRGYKVG